MKKNLLNLSSIVFLLTSCGGGKAAQVIDADYTPELPTFVDKNTGAVKEDETNAYFDFYEISDFHGAVSYDKNDNRLGIERLSTYFDTKRANNPGGTFLLSSGDMFQGTADSNVTRGNLMTYAMDVMDFDEMTLGNHEFDWSDTWIKNNKARATFPFLCANLKEKDTGNTPEFVQKSTIIQRGNYKIGIIGTISDSIRSTILASAIENYEFTNEIQAVKSETAALREAGCDIVAWSSHNDTKELTSSAAGQGLDIDVIFGGHTHTTLKSEIDGIPVLESKDYGRSIPHVQLALNKATKEVSVVVAEHDENPTSVDYQPDSVITNIYKQYQEKWINPLKNEKIGKAKGDFLKSDELPNLAVESMFKATVDHIAQHPEIAQYDIKAAFTNVNGGVRADIKSGTIKYGDVYEAFPFDNEIVVVETTGKWVNGLASNPGNCALYKIFEERIPSSEKAYFITSDFLATGDLKNYGKVVYQTKLTIRDVVADAIRKAKTINAANYKTDGHSQFEKLEA